MFCSKCGKEIPTDSKFCIGCGQSINSDVCNNQILSKEDFLTVSTDYLLEKKGIQNKYNKMFLIIGIIAIICFIAIITILFVSMDSFGTSQQDTYFIILMIFASLFSVDVVICLPIVAITHEKKIQDLGNDYYRKYVSDFNSKK